MPKRTRAPFAALRAGSSLTEDLSTLADLYVSVFWWMARRMRERRSWPWLSPGARTHRVAPMASDHRRVDPLLLGEQEEMGHRMARTRHR